MEAYEGIMNSTRAPFSILPKPIDEDGNTVTTTGGADDDRYAQEWVAQRCSAVSHSSGACAIGVRMQRELRSN